jgi:hypothetical protein
MLAAPDLGDTEHVRQASWPLKPLRVRMPLRAPGGDQRFHIEVDSSGKNQSRLCGDHSVASLYNTPQGTDPRSGRNGQLGRRSDL